MVINLKINSLRTGFEHVRVTPSDFESDALTTRPSQLYNKTIIHTHTSYSAIISLSQYTHRYEFSLFIIGHNIMEKQNY